MISRYELGRRLGRGLAWFVLLAVLGLILSPILLLLLPEVMTWSP